MIQNHSWNIHAFPSLFCTVNIVIPLLENDVFLWYSGAT